MDHRSQQGRVGSQEKRPLKVLHTCFGIFLCGFGGPGTGLHVASLLQSKHEASIPDHNLACVETLQNSLSERTNGSVSVMGRLFRVMESIKEQAVASG